MTKFLLIILMALTVNIAMTEIVTTRLELWQITAEFLAIFGIVLSMAWYEYRQNRFYIVVKVSGIR